MEEIIITEDELADFKAKLLQPGICISEEGAYKVLELIAKKHNAMVADVYNRLEEIHPTLS